MEDRAQNNGKKKGIAAIIAVASAVVIIFLCIFSLYHLPERDPVRTPEIAVNPNDVESPAGDFQETNDIMSASQEQVSEMLGDLEMQYQNAQLNSDPYAAQQVGLRLALAYWKAGEKQQAMALTDSLMQSYSFDEAFVAKCREFRKLIDSPDQQ